MLAHFGHHLLTALPVPLLPYIRNEFNLSYTRSALVNTSFSLSYGIGQLPAGWLADRIGTRILITIGILGVAIAGALVGVITDLHHDAGISGADGTDGGWLPPVIGTVDFGIG